MEEDLAYKYFMAALNGWVAEKKKNKDPAQKILALGLKTEEGTISRYLNPKREKPIPFESQTKIANVCGHTYLSFLQLGKNIIDGKKAENNIYAFDKIEQDHQALTLKFKDKVAGYEVNQNLIELEQLNSEEFYAIVGRIKGKVKTLKSEPQPPAEAQGE
jgi:transcriptional regulator with XRE-family HTH domain